MAIVNGGDNVLHTAYRFTDHSQCAYSRGTGTLHAETGLEAGGQRRGEEAKVGVQRTTWAIDKKDEDTAANAEDETLYKDQNATWADKHLPESVLPYAKLARVDRPIGTYLLLLPGLWSIGLAAEPGHLPNLELMALFGIGAFVMRGAGCTINDFWDRDIDGKVKRTRQRPLASGRVSPLQAWAFLAAQCSIGLAVLVQMNTFTIALGAASLVPVALYPLAKRYIGWPQAVLGLTFNWGALLGWAAVHGDLDLSVTVPLYLGGALWTLMYDTIYAHQDKEDDRALGLRSSALTIGDEMAKPVLAGFGAGALALWALAGANAGLGASPLYLGALGCTGAHFAWQIGTADLDDRLNLTQRFVSNQTVGAIMLAGIVGGKYML
ncbi:4-hydroxybenzoate polyprenyltransferase, mitochondrial [Hondaea fermentalgiana]|uniref:4-hydroxybenzoate polyprenyltransferase, mitochondrial n=1 Tax=Hondaea fermentalgiana TaxID=2315210 RepID=A0A2R5G7R5_9STRA|nr:4-hydroxybenzoate polyprenyltransferase, mitochondrial [Hondaea fermentalgiana]|eukprot:GBG27077.1 4-hydroxybenzoate polyprenyltransferase, mitochondrial [Hondaea fermentalgiana]